MVTAGWVALILLGSVLYAVLVYLISIGFRAEGMRDPATAPCDRPLRPPPACGRFSRVVRRNQKSWRLSRSPAVRSLPRGVGWDSTPHRAVSVGRPRAELAK